MIKNSLQSALEIIKVNPGLYSPLSVRFEDAKGNRLNTNQQMRINLKAGEKEVQCSAVLITSNLLRVIELEILKAAKRKNEGNLVQILIVPFITKEVKRLLEEEAVSAFDLNGNYYVVTPELVAIRLDQKNRFKEQRVIQNIYSRNSSMAVRWLLSGKTAENNLNQIKQELDKSGSGLSLGTISKVLKILEEDVQIYRTPGLIKVLKPDELLVKLKSEYRKPKVLLELKIKLPENRSEAAGILGEALGKNSWIWSGESSADRYASTLQPDITKVYTKSNPQNTTLVQLSDQRYYNCIVEYIREPLVYFEADENYAHPIQSYIEMARSDKRNQEIAEDIKRIILNGK